MPKYICLDCGTVHSSKMDTCQSVSERTRATHKVGKASKSVSREVSPEMCEDISAMSLMECEHQALADVIRIELEDRVLLLEGKGARLLMERGRRRSQATLAAAGPADSGGHEQTEAVTVTEAVTADASGDGRAEKSTNGHSSYGQRHARRHSRGRRHRSSSSSSRSRRRSRRRCKYTIAKKEVRKFNTYELIGASICWFLDIEDLTLKDHRAF